MLSMIIGIAEKVVIRKKVCNILTCAPDFKYKVLGDIYGWESIYARSGSRSQKI